MRIEVSRAPRYALQLVLQYRPSAAVPWVKARTENISSSGVLFVAEGLLAVDTPIEMTLVMPPEMVGAAGVSVVCVGRVVRAVPPSAAEGRPVLAATIAKFRLARGDG